jgi:hypothetical protein
MKSKVQPTSTIGCVATAATRLDLLPPEIPGPITDRLYNSVRLMLLTAYICPNARNKTRDPKEFNYYRKLSQDPGSIKS